MADVKISALPASTTPLAGTEVLPIVQGGATKQVSVTNLTAGKYVTVSSLSVGNTTDPSANNLSVTGTGVFSGNLTGTNIVYVSGNASDTQFQFNVSGYYTNWIKSFVANNAMGFATNNVEKMRIHGSGGLSLGNTTDPGAGNLSVTGTGKFTGTVTSSGTTPLSWTGVTTAQIVAGTTGSASSLFINTPSLNSSFSSGLGIDGTYGTPALRSVVVLHALGVRSTGGYGADLAINTTLNGNDVEQMRVFATGGVSIGNTTDKGAASLNVSGLIFPQQATTAAAPAYQKGAIYFDTTLNKLRVGGATAWETITSV